MTIELELFAVSVHKNKLCFEFKNKVRAISCSTKQNFGESFIYVAVLVKNFASAQIFMFIILKVANLVYT